MPNFMSCSWRLCADLSIYHVRDFNSSDIAVRNHFFRGTSEKVIAPLCVLSEGVVVA